MGSPIDGRTIVITGASEGIGRALARELDGRAARLILVARREAPLHQLAAELRGPTEVVPCDLSTEEGPDQLLAALSPRDVHLLVNNAGVTVGGAFGARGIEPVRAMLRLNIEAPLRLIHGLLPHWRLRGEGAVLNVASVAAFIPCPGQTAYAATKAFLHSFGEGLGGEWRLGVEEGVDLRLTTLAPGSTRTRFFQEGGIDADRLWKRMQDPRAVARAAVRGLERGAPLVIPGLGNRALDLLLRVVPRSVSRAGARWVLGPLARGEATLGEAWEGSRPESEEES
ncbi:MAG: SDR family NAD(P)-dependent oxidoreductase [Planctomycetota bacterium]